MRDRLDLATLRRVARAVAAARRDPRGTPWAPLLDVAQGLDSDEAITVDFSACDVLGHPLVVLRSRPDGSLAGVFSTLSARERDVVGLVADGLSNAAIARRLRISIGTTKDHVHHVLAKTGFRRRTQVVAAWVASLGA